MDYRTTLNLPQTEFPMRAGLAQREPDWVQRWLDEDIYKQMREKSAGKPKFILHCGPPYANGRLHVGHLIPNILKDIVVRSKGFAGYDAPFVPGWDCHGLPIESKVEKNLREQGKKKEEISTEDFLALCREYAGEWVEKQKDDWRRMGCTGDWDKPYRTMDFGNEANIIRELGRLMNTGLLYKGVKAVMWSPNEGTALAEAEVEYHDHESTAIYVHMPIVGRDNESVLIWTTTPWTMPSNKGVAFGKDEDYVALKPTELFEKATATMDQVIWVAKDLAEDVAKMIGFIQYEVVAEQKGSAFEGQKCLQPVFGDEVPLVEGFHVTTDAGTGFVHIAPSHGAEDFQIGQQFGLDAQCRVDGDGCYTADMPALPTTGQTLTGNSIWDMQKPIINELTETGRLLRWHKVKHSYPCSWRSKTPLIFRTTPQWFVAMDGKAEGSSETLRENALREIKNVRWVPAYGEKRITAMVEGRPDWCISRQRKWGVPIAIFRNVETGEFLANQEVFEAVATKIEEQGIAAWHTLSVEELLPAQWLQENGLTADQLEKETDILDVWIDSGTTYAHVVEQREELRGTGDKPHQSDLYLEGSDQHRGWFMSSLMMSAATRGCAPYRQVLTHGFVVDEQGRKISKSVGNGIDAFEAMGTYGADIMRLWVASSDYSDDIRFGETIMKGVMDVYRRFRNTYRFLLGNLDGFDEARDTVAYADMPEMEQYILSRFAQVMEQAREDYDNYRFNKVVQGIQNFCSIELSSLYFDVRKDTLYCDGKDSDRRKACQTVLMALLRGLTTYLAPFLPFTTDEVWRERFGTCIHLEEFLKEADEWKNEDIINRWQRVLEIRSEVTDAIEKQARATGLIGSSLEGQVTLTLPAEDFDALASLEWEDILIISQMTLIRGNEVAVVAEKADGEKCPRCWMYSHNDHADHVCERCDDALQTAKLGAA